MAKALPMVKKMVTSLVDSGTKVPRWVLTNFKDPDVKLVTSATEVEELREKLDELKYGGGGDLDEQALKGKGEPHMEIKVLNSLRNALHATISFSSDHKGLSTYYVSRWRGGRASGKC